MEMRIDKAELESVITETMTRFLNRDLVPVSTAPPTTSALSGAVRAEFARRKIDKQDLAQVIGMSKPTATLRMRGIYPFLPEEVRKVAAFFGMTVQELFAMANLGERLSRPRVADFETQEVDLYAQPPRALYRRGRAY